MTAGAFADLVLEMRDLQKKWQKEHSYLLTDDPLSKKKSEAEKKVDKFLKERQKRLSIEAEQLQGKLFE